MTPAPPDRRADAGGAFSDWVAPVFFAVSIAGTALAVDGAVPGAYDTPKTAVVMITAAIGALAWAAAGTWGRGTIRLSALDLLLVAGVALGALAHPELLGRSDIPTVPLGIALVALTFLTRQLVAPRPGDASEVGARAGDLVHAVWISGVLLALPVLRAAAVSIGSPASVVGTVGTVNGFAATVGLGVVAAVAAATWTDDRSLRRWVHAAAAVCALALLVNGSRGALLGATAGVGTVILLSRSRTSSPRLPSWRTLGALAALLVVGAGGLALLDPGSSGGRLLVWRMTLPMIADHPLAGVGPGRFGAEFPGYQAAFWAKPGNLTWAHKASELLHPHGDLLLRFAETGLPGGLLLLAVWIGAAASLLRWSSTDVPRSGPAAALLALLVTILVHGAVDTLHLVVPVAVAFHLIVGTAPGWTRTVQPPRGAWLAILAVTIGVAAWGAPRTAREYSGHRLWQDGRTTAGAAGLESLRAASHRLPGHAALQAELGTALGTAGRLGEAIQVLDDALAEGAPPAHRLTLSALLLDADAAARAAEEARRYLAVFPDRLRPRLLLARSHLARGDVEAAREELARCIRRETAVRSPAVDAVAVEAEALWRTHFDDPPPEADRGGADPRDRADPEAAP